MSSEPWFKRAVLYQIYPRSFYDANGDGIGDLPGIIQKLDYLSGQADSLGVSAIWLSPFYPSPMADFGYDISNYCDVDPIFGSLDDFKQLLREAHQRNLKVIIDFVPNHTSDTHPWFSESRASRDNPKRDWYVWRDGLPGNLPPNNWLSEFGGPAWEFDETTGQYYLHSFLTKQPDLNWDNPALREAMCGQMKFWLDIGVNGFRVDAVPWISKDPGFRDNPPNQAYREGKDDPAQALMPTYNRSGPHLYEYLHDMAETVRAYPDTFMVTEAYPRQWDSVNAYMRFYEQVDPRVCAPFNFEGIFAPWDAAEFKQIIHDFQQALKPEYVPVYCFGNHDRSRLASRLGPDSARTAAMLLLTLPGMPTIYYGDELGMQDGTLSPDDIRDPFEKQVPGKGLGRDPQRTPLMWDGSPNAGFSSAKPWLPVTADYRAHNIAVQAVDTTSFLNLYRQLLALRNGSPALHSGTYTALDTPANVFGYRRRSGDEELTILLNFSDQPVTLTAGTAGSEILLTTYLDDAAPPAILRPHEGVIIR